MTDQVIQTFLNLACGGLLLTAVLVLWRRELKMIIRAFAAQGVMLALIVALLAALEGSGELVVVALGVLLMRAVVLPWLLGRALVESGPGRRETRPVVNVTASLLIGAVLTLLAYLVSRPMVELAPSMSTVAVPVGLTLVLIGFFVLVTRRRALSQLVGFLLMDNGVTAVGFLLTAGIGGVIELAVSLDVLLAVLVLQVLVSRVRQTFGDADLDELSELRD